MVETYKIILIIYIVIYKSRAKILELKNKNTYIIKHAHDKKLFDICKYYRKNQSDQTKR